MQLQRAAKLCFSLADRPRHVELCGVVLWPRVGDEASFAPFEQAWCVPGAGPRPGGFGSVGESDNWWLLESCRGESIGWRATGGQMVLGTVNVGPVQVPLEDLFPAGT